MTQIGLGVQKVCFYIFFRFLLSVRVKKEPKKFAKNFLAFSCLEWLKKKSKIPKSPKVGTVLGPFGPKTQNTTHQSSITPLLHSFYQILSSYKKLLKTVKPLSRYSTLKNRAIWLDEPFLAIFGQIRIFPKYLIRPLFTPYTPPTSCKKSEKTNEAILRKIPKTSLLGYFWPFLAKFEFSQKIGRRQFCTLMVP